MTIRTGEKFSLAALFIFAFTVLTLPAGAQTATAVMKNAEGKEVGSVNLTQKIGRAHV